MHRCRRLRRRRRPAGPGPAGCPSSRRCSGGLRRFLRSNPATARWHPPIPATPTAGVRSSSRARISLCSGTMPFACMTVSATISASGHACRSRPAMKVPCPACVGRAPSNGSSGGPVRSAVGRLARGERDVGADRAAVGEGDGRAGGSPSGTTGDRRCRCRARPPGDDVPRTGARGGGRRTDGQRDRTMAVAAAQSVAVQPDPAVTDCKWIATELLRRGHQVIEPDGCRQVRAKPGAQFLDDRPRIGRAGCTRRRGNDAHPRCENI